MEPLKEVESLFHQYGILAFLPIAIAGFGLGIITKLMLNKFSQRNRNKQTQKQKKFSKLTNFLLRAYLAFWVLIVLYAILPIQLWFIALVLGIYWTFKPPQFILTPSNEPPIEYQIEALENKIKKLLAKKHLTERDRLKLIEYQVKLTNLKEKVGYEKGYEEGYLVGKRRGSC